MKTKSFLWLLLLLISAWSCKQEEEVCPSRSQSSSSTGRIAATATTQLAFPSPDITYMGIRTGVYFIRPLVQSTPSLALEIPRDRLENGVIIQQNYLIGNPDSQHQWWYVSYLGNGYYVISNWQSGKCLEVPSGSVSGAKIQQNEYKGGSNQQWRIAYSISKGICWITNRQTGLALDVPGFSITPREQIQQYTPNGGTNQTWLFSLTGGLII